MNYVPYVALLLRQVKGVFVSRMGELSQYLKSACVLDETDKLLAYSPHSVRP